MSPTFYGFMTKSSFIRNEDNVISEFYELSPLALTFSRNRQEHQASGYPGDVLHVFHNRDAVSTINSTGPQELVNEVFEICKLVYAYFHDNYGNTSASVIKQYINSIFQGDIYDLTLGQITETASLDLPDWISWKSMRNNTTEVRIWLRNLAFENQYPVYDITVIPPFANLETFFGNYGNVVHLIDGISITQFSETVELAKQDHPASYTRYIEFQLVNKDNPDQKKTCVWGVIIYGRDGDNIDNIKDAIISYVLANSTRTQEAWEVIFPGIFKRTEFMFFPRWDLIAAQNVSDLSSLYRSIIGTKDAETFVKAHHPETSITTTFVQDRLSIIPFDYKAICCAVLCGQTNLSNSHFLSQIFPDYLPMPTTSPDFNRMTILTRNWVLGMVDALNVAESAADFSIIRNPLRRVRRNGSLFIAFLYNNINYLIAAKSNSYY